MTIYDKIREISGMSISGIDEDQNIEWIGTDVQMKKAEDIIEKYDNGDLDSDEIEEIWEALGEDLPEDKINLPNN
jgi:hypothetical protein